MTDYLQRTFNISGEALQQDNSGSPDDENAHCQLDDVLAIDQSNFSALLDIPTISLWQEDEGCAVTNDSELRTFPIREIGYHQGSFTTEQVSLLTDYEWLARHIAGLYIDKVPDLYKEDVLPAAVEGLANAAVRFDPELGVPFAGFASPTIHGTVKHFLRDETWPVHVPRGLKDDLNNAQTVMREYKLQETEIKDIADKAQLSEGQVREALSLRGTRIPSTLNEDIAVPREVNAPVFENQAGVVADLHLAHLLQQLPERLRTIVALRQEGMSQQDIGDELGISQVHVSRLYRQALEQLRQHIIETDSF